MDKITKHELYWPGLLIFSKHTEAAQNWKPGLKLTVTNKIKFCERFKYLAAVSKILPNEFKTVHELGSFGKSSNGTYRSQSGNDDLAMTCVNTSAFFESPNFWEIANEEIEKQPKDYMERIYTDFLSEVYVKKDSKYDFGTLRSLNSGGVAIGPGKSTKIDDNYVSHYRETFQKFYGGYDEEIG